METRHERFCLFLFILITMPSFAGIRGAGEYSGVVIFDCWGGCTLYSGVYVMYISEEIKEEFRPYANQCVKINTTEVFQPMNPGDGLIKAFNSVDPFWPPSKPPPDVWLEGVQLKNLIACKEGQKPAVLMQIINRGSKPVEIYSEELAPTLLMKQTDDTKGAFVPADGPSVALITRQAFWVGGYPGGASRWHGGGARHGTEYQWIIGEENALPRIFKLQPGEKRRIKITFDLPPGEYEFLSGYGGGVHAGRCIAGNGVAFDVDENGLTKRPLETSNLKYNPVQWCVNNDLPEEAIDHRDELLSKADQYIRDGLTQFAKKYLHIRKARDFERTISGRSEKGRISIGLGHTHLGKAKTTNDPVPENEQFSVLVILQEPPRNMIAMAMGAAYHNLGLVGQIHAMAGDPELEAELKKLVDDALKPLKQFNDSLNVEANDQGAQNVSEKPMVFRDLSTDDDFSCILSVGSNQYSIGEPILVKVRLTNHMDRDVITRDCDGHYDFYAFEVIGPDSKALSLNEYIPRSFMGFNPKEYVIKPGESYGVKIDIADWYPISKPGTYSIRAKWCCYMKRAPYERESNMISIKVIPTE